MTEPRRSQLSGDLLEPGAATNVICVFDDGHRAAVVMSAQEADNLRQSGEDRTSPIARAAAVMRRNAKSLLKWVAVAVAGAFIGQMISDRYADRQRELELEASLVTAISRDSIKLFQEAQDASRATDDPAQIEKRNRAADAWVRSSNAFPTPMFQTYFAATPVLGHWNAYQDAMYDWGVLGCCTTVAGRAAIVDELRTYLETRVGPPNSSAPTADPWATLKTGVHTKTYQWLGLYLLRGRGALLRDMREATPGLD